MNAPCHRLIMWPLLLIVVVSGVSCVKVESIAVPVGRPFSFDCQNDESVYFARRLDDWSEVQENNNKYAWLNLNFNSLPEKNILRVTLNSVQSESHGYYGCRKATWTTTAMNRIYQLVVADVQSFYWTYTCHAPGGSCIRTDDSFDETLSTFEVADRTNVDVYCCASVMGFKNINVNMNQIGETRGKIHVHRKQELDGSWVVCANQHTVLKRTASRNPETLTCELLTDNQSYSTLSSNIVMKDAMPVDPDIDPPYGYTPPSRGGNDDYFNRSSAPGRRGRLSTGKRVAIIIGAVLGGLTLLGLLFLLIFTVRRKRSASTNSRTTKSNEYSSVNTNEKRSPTTEQDPQYESTYLQPTPLYQNTTVTFRV